MNWITDGGGGGIGVREIIQWGKVLAFFVVGPDSIYLINRPAPHLVYQFLPWMISLCTVRGKPWTLPDMAQKKKKLKMTTAYSQL